MVELVGESPTGAENAIRNTIAQTAAAPHDLGGSGLVERRGQIEDGKVAHRLVRLKWGIRIEP